MKMDRERVERIISKYLGGIFFFNTIIDVNDDYCITFYGEEKSVERTFAEFLTAARELLHPLFLNRFESEVTVENLKTCYREDRSLRAEFLMLNKEDGQYHWFRARLIPIDDGTGHEVFFLNALPVDDVVKRNEETRSEMFNKAVIDRLLYNYILVYVIDLSNGMSRLVYSTEGDNYDVYAKTFKSHLDMMKDLKSTYVSDDFILPFERFMDYDYIKKQLDSDKDRLVLIFRDKNGTAFEMLVSKYPEYADDYPLVIFSLKELS